MLNLVKTDKSEVDIFGRSPFPTKKSCNQDKQYCNKTSDFFVNSQQHKNGIFPKYASHLFVLSEIWQFQLFAKKMLDKI